VVTSNEYFKILSRKSKEKEETNTIRELQRKEKEKK
jgi:hypothetical protein